MKKLISVTSINYRDRFGTVAILSKNTIYVITKEGIQKRYSTENFVNAINPNERGLPFLFRLTTLFNKGLSFYLNPKENDLELWPDLVAAGRGDYVTASKWEVKRLTEEGRFDPHDGSDKYAGSKQNVFKNKSTGEYYVGKIEAPEHFEPLYANRSDILHKTVAIPEETTAVEARAAAVIAFMEEAAVDASNSLLSDLCNTAYEVSQDTAMWEAHVQSCGRDPGYNEALPAGDEAGVEFVNLPLEGLDTQFNDYNIFIPNDIPGIEALSIQDIHQVLRELTIGIFGFNQLPSFSLDPNYDKSMVGSMPPCYQNTLVAQAMGEIDYWLKATMMGNVFESDVERTYANQHWRSVFMLDKNQQPQKEPTMEEMRKLKATYLLDHPKEKKIYQFIRSEEGKFDSNLTVHFTWTSKVKDVCQIKNSVFCSPAADIFLGVGSTSYDRDRVDRVFAARKELTLDFFHNHSVLKRYIAITALSGFFIHFLTSLKQTGKVIQLKNLIPPRQVKTTKEFPPFLCFDCPTLHFHGGTVFNKDSLVVKPGNEEMGICANSFDIGDTKRWGHTHNGYYGFNVKVTTVTDKTARQWLSVLERSRDAFPVQVQDKDWVAYYRLRFGDSGDTRIPGTGITLRYAAAFSGFVDVLRHYRSNGMDLFPENDKFSALKGAVAGKKIDVLHYLISQGGSLRALEKEMDLSILHYFIREDLLEMVRFVLRGTSLDPYKEDETGITPLQLAIQLNQHKVVKLLLEFYDVSEECRGVLVKSKVRPSRVAEHLAPFLTEPTKQTSQKHKFLPLHTNASVQGSSTEVTKLLVQKKLDLLAYDESGATPLHCAAEAGNIAVYRYLIECGVNPLSLSRSGHTSAHYSTFANQAKMLLDLLNSEDKKEQLTSRRMFTSIKGNSGDYPIHIAVQAKSYNVLKLLVSHAQSGLDILCRDANGYTALHLAIHFKDTQAIQILAQSDEMLTANLSGGRTAIQFAFWHEIDEESLSMLVTRTQQLIQDTKEVGAEYNSDAIDQQYIGFQDWVQRGQSRIGFAAALGYVKLFKQLRRYGCNPRFQDEKKQTPAHFATLNNYPAIITALATENPDHEFHIRDNFTETNFSKPDLEGNYPIHIALNKSSFAVLDKFIEFARAGHNIFVKDANGNSVMHLAIQTKNYTAIQKLADVSGFMFDLNTAGENPLIVAIREELPNEILSILLDKANEEIDLLSPQRLQALEIASQHEDKRCFDFLISKDQATIDQLIVFALKNENDELARFIVLYSGVDFDHLSELPDHKVTQSLMSYQAFVEDQNIDKVFHPFFMAQYLMGGQPIMPSLKSIWKTWLRAKDESENTLLHVCATLGDVGLGKHLIEADLDLKQQNIHGELPIHVAIKHKCRTLHDAWHSLSGDYQDIVIGEDETVLNTLYETDQLSSACMSKSYVIPSVKIKKADQETTEALIQDIQFVNILGICKFIQTHGLNCVTTDPGNATLIGLVILEGQVELLDFITTLTRLETLHSKNSHKTKWVDQRVTSGQTSLMTALSAQQYEMAVALLSYQPRLDLKRDSDGKTGLHLARDHNQTTLMVKIIKAQKATLYLTDNAGHDVYFDALNAGATEQLNLLFRYGSMRQEQFDRAWGSFFVEGPVMWYQTIIHAVSWALDMQPSLIQKSKQKILPYIYKMDKPLAKKMIKILATIEGETVAAQQWPSSPTDILIQIQNGVNLDTYLFDCCAFNHMKALGVGDEESAKAWQEMRQFFGHKRQELIYIPKPIADQGSFVSHKKCPRRDHNNTYAYSLTHIALLSNSREAVRQYCPENYIPSQIDVIICMLNGVRDSFADSIEMLPEKDLVAPLSEAADQLINTETRHNKYLNTRLIDALAMLSAQSPFEKDVLMFLVDKGASPFIAISRSGMLLDKLKPEDQHRKSIEVLNEIDVMQGTLKRKKQLKQITQSISEMIQFISDFPFVTDNQMLFLLFHYFNEKKLADSKKIEAKYEKIHKQINRLSSPLAIRIRRLLLLSPFIDFIESDSRC